MDFFDCGLTGRDWVKENESNVQVVADLIYSRASNRISKWVLAVPENSSIETVKDLEGKKITTIEGLNNNGSLSLLQTTFMEERAGQCGYCIPGIIMSAELLLKKNPHPNREDIKRALSKNLCRCGAHNSILKAIEKAVNHQS